MQPDQLTIGDVLTYHKDKSLISSFSEKFWGYPFFAKAPSHVLICTGVDSVGKPVFTEADWGEGVFLMPWIRRNSGVRQISWKKLCKRKGRHLVWRVSDGLDRPAKKRIQRFAQKKLLERTRYDYIGLFSAALDTVWLERMGSFHDPRAFFCSEFVSACLAAGNVKQENSKPFHRISPAMTPSSWKLKCLGFLSQK